MGNTADGSYPTTPELVMRAFDRLPNIVRHRLSNAIDDWVPQPLLTKYKRSAGDAFAVIDRIEEWDRRELATRERQRMNGSGPYKGNVPDKNVGKRRRK